jgi:hypothetical protein
VLPGDGPEEAGDTAEIGDPGNVDSTGEYCAGKP